MSSNVTRSVCLPYGYCKTFSYEFDEERVVGTHTPPEQLDDLSSAVREALSRPLDFPPFEQATVPGDKVVLAVDPNTPAADVVVAEIWKMLERRGVCASDVTIVQPAAPSGNSLTDPRLLLPTDVQAEVAWVLHDAAGDQSCGYLASSASGERLYLARCIVEADLVIPIGTVGFDPLLGYRGTGSVLFPGLSNREAVEKARGQGHLELGPDDDRPLRQLVDEVAWLLGVQYCLQVLPATGTHASAVIGGLNESVMKRGKAMLADQWGFTLPERAEIVVVSVDDDAGGHTWEQIGSALATARNLVVPGGKIIVLSELSADPGLGMEFVAAAESANDAIKPLRLEAPADVVPATQLVNAVQWADVYLLSPLAAETLEDLFLIPLANESEVTRLLEGDETCTFVPHAQHTWGRVEAE